ncbi:unnamed protein product [Alopecurus aequalis]
MIREILLRLPPQPSSLPRAAAVYKRWRGLVADPRFLRELRAHHRKPPLLGVFLRKNRCGGVAFSPILGPPDRVPRQRFKLRGCSSAWDGYNLVDCRHGLVLLKNRSPTVVVCDPVTGQQHRVAVPPEHTTHFFNGAVLCAATDQGHVHGSCHSSPFKLVLMSWYTTADRPLARVYSSQTDAWSNPILTDAPCEISRKPVVLVGNRLYWLSKGYATLVEFDMGEHSLTLIGGPPVTDRILFGNCQIIQAEDGALGYAILSKTHFQVWQRSIGVHGVTTWVLSKTIELHTILGPPSPQDEGIHVQLLGHDEDDIVFLCYYGSVYMVQLKTMQSRKLDESHSTRDLYFPFKSFYTSGLRI